MSTVDIVLRWVDNHDLLWQKEKHHFQGLDRGTLEDTASTDATDIRYRDWELLKYWFRGVETFAPWFNNIFFITCGQKPVWMVDQHPKLKFVNHKDYIPHEWLPTFSSRTIDLNIHRIPELSERFILFDDDMFLINYTKETDFFRNGLPCDSMVFNAITASTDDVINTNIYNNMAIINKHFNKDMFSSADKRNLWFSFKYREYLYKNIVLSPWKYYVGFQDFHLPEGFLKSTFINVWEEEQTVLSDTCSHKFRKTTDVTQWLIRYWQLVNKQFVPRSPSIGAYYELSDDNSLIVRTIRKQKNKLICINEGNVSDFELEKRRMIEAFESILPTPSSFEKT